MIPTGNLKGRVLHVGSGGGDLPEWCGKCDVVSLDIDPKVNPDIVADMLDMGEIGTFDIILTSHVLEHLYDYQIPKALSEFRRVLNNKGTIITCVPDLEGIEANDEILYRSMGGVNVTGMHMIYGMIELLDIMPHMAHHTGFTKERLEKLFEKEGFKNIVVNRVPFNLIGVCQC